MYKVIRFFRDLQDKNHAYHVGDSFPHDGVKVSEERLVELSTDANRRHMPLIEKVEDEAVEAESVAEDTAKEPVEGFMNPPEVEEPEATPEEKPEELKEESQKPKKKRGRPRNDAE